MISNWLRIVASGCLAVLGTRHAYAEASQMPWESSPPPSVINDKLRLDVGYWRADIDTHLRSDATAQQLGSELDGESDVGLSKGGSIANVELTLLPGQRQLIRVDGFSSHRNGSSVLTRTVQYDGNTYLLGQTVKSTLNLDMLGMGYAWRLFKQPRLEVDVGADVQIASFEANVYVPQSGVRQADSGAFPIPMLDGDIRWQFWRQFALIGRYRWLGGSGNDGKAKGAVRDWRYGVAWQFNQHLNVGVYQHHFGINATVTSGSHPGAFDMAHGGWELAVRASL